MRNLLAALGLGLLAALVGCKAAPTQSAAPPKTTVAKDSSKGQSSAAPAKPAEEEQVELTEMVIPVEIPACTPEEWAEKKDKSHGGRGCPMKDSGTILGIRISSPHGIIVSEVVPGGPADKAGIKVGDSIIACNGKPTSCPSVLRPMIVPKKQSYVVKLTIRRAKAAAETQAASSAGSDHGNKATAEGAGRSDNAKNAE